MPPKNFNWNFDRECLLIQFYKEHDMLWRTSHPNYHKAKTSTLVDDLADLLGNVFTVEEIHRRFVTLRSTFRENMKKVRNKKSGSAGSEYFVPVWPHYNRLMFLADTFTERCSLSTLPDTITTERSLSCSPVRSTQGSSFVFNENEFEVFSEEDTLETGPTSASLSKRNLNNITPSTASFAKRNLETITPSGRLLSNQRLDNSSGSSGNVGKGKKNKRSRDDDEGDNILAKAKECLFSDKQIKKRSAYHFFGEFVAESLREMGPSSNRKAQLAMLEMQTTLMKYSTNEMPE